MCRKIPDFFKNRFQYRPIISSRETINTKTKTNKNLELDCCYNVIS